MKTKIFVALCVLSFLCACKSASTPELHDFKIVGKVTNGNTGMGIAQVLVELIEMQNGREHITFTHTDGNGRYVLNFRIIYSSDYQLQASKSGYHAALGSFYDSESFEDTEETQTINFKLYPD